jgi:hypothetical protein
MEGSVEIITKYGVLMRMVCEDISGFICNMGEIYPAEGMKM